MAKEDNGGLLSRVVRFVRNPTTNWADLDQPDSGRESAFSKQALKEMIERKRRNDFVRKREFDMLRKMRKREVVSGTALAARPSFFQSSMPSTPDDRAMTIKKIDEIEAQMSMQWWKTKNGGESSSSMGSQFSPSSVDSSGLGDLPSITPTERAASYARTDPAPLETPGRSRGMVAASLGTAPDGAGGRMPVPGGGLVNFEAINGRFSSSADAIEVGEFAHDPELEEAAIRFANGDDEGAEAGLLEALGDQGTRSLHLDTWLALFDLYRATAQHERYERAAIDFAKKFGRSAPHWFSIPDQVRQLPQTDDAVVGVLPAHWSSPSSLGVQTLAVLNAALARAESPWRLDWSRLTLIEPGAIAPLHKLFQEWGSRAVQLRFVGAGQLEELLEKATPAGDKSIDPVWWRMRMEVLRIMGRAEDFELVALNYCVTYEVSPPSWERARCEFKPLAEDGGYMPGYTVTGNVSSSSALTSLPDDVTDFRSTTTDSQLVSSTRVELSGSILGDATGWVELLDSKLSSADTIIISCALLARVDFSAAGTMLNWVTARQAEGRQVQLVDAHRLVAAFFNVIGISESARVLTRAD